MYLHMQATSHKQKWAVCKEQQVFVVNMFVSHKYPCLSSHKTAHAYLRSSGPRFTAQRKKRVRWLTTTKSCSMIYQSLLRLLNILQTLLEHSTHCSLYCASLLIVYASMYIPIVLLPIKEEAKNALATQNTLALSSPPKRNKLAGFIVADIVLRV